MTDTVSPPVFVPASVQAGLRARAEALVPDLAARAAETESLRRIPDQNIADLKAAGAAPDLSASALWGRGNPAR